MTNADSVRPSHRGLMRGLGDIDCHHRVLMTVEPSLGQRSPLAITFRNEIRLADDPP